MKKNFEEYEKGIFEKFNPSLSVNDTDRVAMGKEAVVKSIIPQDNDGDHWDLDVRWPYGTYTFLTIKEIYKGQKSVHVFTRMSE
jgi:hypothetical protein